MLEIKNISKRYKTGELEQIVLNELSLNLRDNEFVAILGPSGSGKTTLLNIIGGLDHYDSGDLIINGVSTKNYKERDWDTYRNHTIGFVFQSYNLIPHQTILSNVELALTISGISKSERRQRAKEALEKVGLGEQLHKKPNQLSGGQMQRVAIARALVNNPDILLADEPTGALDSETSIQVMDLLKEVAKDRLVVMVTHNPELADKYASRIVKLQDGKIVGDTNPPSQIIHNDKGLNKNNMKSSMSFLVSLSLSFNNLITKKGRTLLTSFAGSIGIIGIALILALSSGVNTYIQDIQKETMTSYPITITDKTIDVQRMMDKRRGNFTKGVDKNNSKEKDGIYADSSSLELHASTVENDLTSFKKYLDNKDSEIHKYIGENGTIYSYNVSFDVYAYNPDEKVINTSMDVENKNTPSSPWKNMQNNMSSLLGSSSKSAKNFDELMPGSDNQVVSVVTTDSYDLIYGKWPNKYNEVILVLNENNAIDTSALYQLGIISKNEYEEAKDKIKSGKNVKPLNWTYKELCKKTFYLVPSCDYYIKNDDNTFKYIGDDSAYTNQLIDNALPLKITGVIRPKDDAANATLSTPVAYTSLLTNYIIDYTNKSDVVKAQENTPEINVLNNIAFDAKDDEAKVSDTKKYLKQLSVSQKAALFNMLISNQDEYLSYLPQFEMDEITLANMIDDWVDTSSDDEMLLYLYDDYLSHESYEDNLSNFGKVSYDAPTSISIYTDSFDDKEGVSACIANYNKSVDKDGQITYIDYVALIISSITSMVNMISYVLIAFVAVSLIVSCIMIGIITHISVLERTKEIGILRAIGASKANISQVFNAETLIIGLCSGVIGVIVSMILTVPINNIIHTLAENDAVNAYLPIGAAGILIIISVVITVIGGLLPAYKAAKKDPVIALRSE